MSCRSVSLDQFCRENPHLSVQAAVRFWIKKSISLVILHCNVRPLIVISWHLLKRSIYHEDQNVLNALLIQ
jgi:hypothetical protein